MQRLLLVFLALVPAFVSLAEKSVELLSPFTVVSSEKDPTLKQSEAVFEFRFLNPAFRENPEAFVIQSSYNSLPHEIKPDKNAVHELKVAPGKYLFQFYFSFFYQEIYTDSVEIGPGHRTIIDIYFMPSDSGVMSDKPVIYLYPPADLTVTTTVKPTGEFTFTYPAYENGWKGTAHPDGGISIGEKTYPYLFWEARSPFDMASLDKHSGFVVPKDRTIAFLEEKLAAMGLNVKEQTDFITYWGPKMAGNDRNFVQFLFNGQCDQFAELTIDPAPAQLFRVYMLWAPLPEEMDIQPQPQVLRTVNREQFYAIEWGGSELSFLPQLSIR